MERRPSAVDLVQPFRKNGMTPGVVDINPARMLPKKRQQGVAIKLTGVPSLHVYDRATLERGIEVLGKCRRPLLREITNQEKCLVRGQHFRARGRQQTVKHVAVGSWPIMSLLGPVLCRHYRFGITARKQRGKE